VALPTYVSKQNEIGAKYDLGTLRAGITYFTTKQPSAYIDPVTQTYGRYGEQRNQGIELSLAGEPVKGLRLLGGLTLLDAEQQRTPLGANNGKDAIGVPRHQLNVGVDWDVPGVRGLALNARMVNTSTQYADAANTQ
jgi:iron complex outermembrane receptor protein